MSTILTALFITNTVITMGNFNTCFEKLMSWRYEGEEYTNHEADRGGRTKYGISEEVARDSGYIGDMCYLPKNKAKDIYLKKFWIPLKCDLLPEKIAFEVFEVGVHGGIRNDGSSEAVEILQKSINIFLNTVTVKVDGHIGTLTLAALDTVIKKHGEQKIKLWYNIFQGSFYYNICLRDPSQKVFLMGGWTNRLEFK